MVVFLILLLAGVLQQGYGPQKNRIQSSDTLITSVWTVEDGLPVNTVNNIVQDKKGYIWFTTYDGIVRFDGLNFKIYNHSNTPEMPQNRAVFMHMQEGVGIWATLENGGVILIDENGEFTHFDEQDGFTSANSTYMMEDSEGRIWIATFDGLFVYEDGQFSRLFTRETPEENRVSFMYEDIDGSMWVATFDGLVHIDGEQQKVYDVYPGEMDNEFRRIIRTSGGDLLVGGRMGLYLLRNEKLVQPEEFRKLHGETVSYLYQEEDLVLVSSDKALYRYEDEKLITIRANPSYHAVFWYFYKDSNNVLWMINTRGELAILKNGKVHMLKNDENFPNYYFNQMIDDREGNIWLATARNGIVRVKRSRVKVIAKKEGLTGSNILGLFEDSRGRFWVGTRDFGLNMINDNKIVHYREGNGFNSDIVHTIAEDAKGNIWIGHYQEGINKITPSGKIESYQLGFGASVNDVHAIFVSSDSTIWLGTYGGLVKFDPEKEEHVVYNEEDGLAGNLVRYIDEDPDGGLWIGTADGGVSHFSNGSFKNYSVSHGLSSNNIRSVYVDEYDPSTVWIGTENLGLNRIRDDEIESVGVSEGLPDHIVHYISQDKYGWLWMSSNRGVFKIRKEELNAFLDKKAENFSVIHYGRQEGMRNPECNGSFQQGGLRTSDNKFWFSTQEGVAIFKIDPEEPNKVPPNVIIQGITAEGKEYNSTRVSFAPGVNNFQVNFHALTLVTPEKTRFRYMLEGHDEGWTEVNNKRTAVYNEVPLGEYTFKVLAANNDGIWAEEPATASITVEPLFYQEWWFYLLVIAVIGFGYYGAAQLRYRYLMNKQEKMQEVIEGQTAQIRQEKNEIKKQNEIIEKQAKSLRELNKTKDKFLSIIAHDLRSPFQAMLGYSELLLADFEQMDKEELKESLEDIRDSSKSLHNLVENLLNWASLQTGKMQPDPEAFALDELMEKNLSLFTQLANQKDITIHADIESGTRIVADQNMIDTILRNLISNAIKFTGEGGKVSVKMEMNHKNSIINVSDNGIGMSGDMVDKLMKLDANVSRLGTNNEQGTGLGLIISKEMIGLHGGKLDIKSREGEGTTFKITLPKKIKIPTSAES